MKRLLIYLIFAAVLTACSTDPSDLTDNRYEMQFRAAVTGAPVPTRVTGVYTDRYYPVNTLYLTAYHTDNDRKSQYYFIDKVLDHDDVGGIWSATDWYWPFQGKMTFMSYWCPGFSRAPQFDDIEDADGNGMPRMNVDASDLDGYTDFLYLAQSVDCPKTAPTTLTFAHGLTWITLTMRAEVLEPGGTSVDNVKSSALAQRIYVKKVIIEDCARKGFATIVPTDDPTTPNILWKNYNETTKQSYVRDQVFYKILPSPVTYVWEEAVDGSTINPAFLIPVTTTAEKLGEYSGASDSYIGNGLLIIPQNKTSISVEYGVYENHVEKIHKVERYVLRDNSVTWLPGYHYNYNIIFRNYDDIGRNFDVIEEAYAMCLADGAFGLLDSDHNTDGDTQIVIGPIHGGGSGKGDEMDYPEGPKVF